MSYVLCVDDDPDMVAVIKVVLEAEGYECRTAENGETALAMALEEKPSLVLLDMMMPIMNGWDCAAELRKAYGRTLPIVIVTAAEHAEAWRAEVCADAAIAKPFDVQRLVGMVSQHAA
jgi:DNA-binding response OmpR family regulator